MMKDVVVPIEDRGSVSAAVYSDPEIKILDFHLFLYMFLIC